MIYVVHNRHGYYRILKHIIIFVNISFLSLRLEQYIASESWDLRKSVLTNSNNNNTPAQSRPNKKEKRKKLLKNK